MKTKLAMLICALTALSFCASVYASTDDDEGDVIDIGYIDPGQSQNRTGLQIPIHAVYYSGQSRVCVTYSDNVGTVDILLRNNSTGNEVTVQSDSALGTISLPVAFGSGSYIILFYTESGAVYSGCFLVI